MKSKIIFKGLLKAIAFQIKKENAFKNIFITHDAFGIFSENSHRNVHCNTGTAKVMHNTYEGAMKHAEKMSKKYGVHFSVYKCAYCTGYHIGRNKENRAE